MSRAACIPMDEPPASDRGPAERDPRYSPRSNLLLAAAIEADSVSGPVRIRNLSDTGALIEGPALPNVGDRLTLRRLDVAVAATVVWLAAPRCGVAFDGRIRVAEWIPGKPGAGASGQSRADALPAAIRGAVAAPAPVARSDSRSDAGGMEARLADELAYVRRLLEGIGEELVTEAGIVHRHAKALQSFDLAGQILSHVAAILIAEDRNAAVGAIGMTELRGRLRGKSAV